MLTNAAAYCNILKTISIIDFTEIKMEIKKRSGDIAKFDVGKIGAAMRKAFAATGVAVEESRMDELSLSVQQQLEGTPMVTVEQVQDCIEQTLMAAGYYTTAKRRCGRPPAADAEG